MGVPADKISPKHTELNRSTPVLTVKSGQGKTHSLSFINRIDKLNQLINNLLGWLAGASLLVMVLLVVGNAVSRVVYVPFVGATEVVGWLSAITTAFALGFTQLQKGYVEIDALMERFPKRIQHFVKFLMDLISLSFFTMVSVKMLEYGAVVAKNGNLSETMGIPYYHLIYLVAVGFIGLSVALFVDLLRQLAGGVEK